MATPANPLDKFASYTYHFELHAATAWSKLSPLESKLSSLATDRFTPNGTLVINSRLDAHQVIEDVKFMMMGAQASRTEMLTPVGVLEMTIIEPGGFSFLEKLENLRMANKVSNLCDVGLMWALKIIFVGRKPDNTVETIQAKLLPMYLLGDMTASFDHRGGTYHMRFNFASNMAAVQPGADGAQKNVAFIDKNISFKAATIAEAFSALEQRLNAGYDEIYKKEAVPNGKKIVYSITYDARIKGAVTGLNKDTNAPGEPKIFTFNPNKQIGAFIMDILTSSKELCVKIAASQAGLNQQFHPGIFIPIITPNITTLDDKILINYNIGINDGTKSSKFTFDYYFADAGKNVDVMHYDVKFQNVSSWIPQLITFGADKKIGQSAKIAKADPKTYSQNIVHADLTRSADYVETQRFTPPQSPNDAATQPVPTVGTTEGFNSTPFDMTAAMRQSLATIAFFQTAINPEQVFEIRGHLDLLNSAISKPDGSYVGGAFDSIWVKVNIYMPDGKGGKRQFFYQDYYRLNTITSTFSRGMFTQQISMMMVTGGL